MTETFDHVVVGGGIVGTSVARGLAKRGSGVLVLEAREVAAGASGGHGTRGMRANQRDVREMSLAARSYELWRKLVAELGMEHAYVRDGLLSLDVDGTRSTLGEAGRRLAADLQNAYGIRTEVLTPDQVRALVPEVSATVTGAIFTPDDGSADHTALTRAVAADVTAHGGQVWEHCAVGRIEDAGTAGVRLQCADGRVVTAADGVVLAVNSHVNSVLGPSFDVRLPVVPFAPLYSILDLPDDYDSLPVVEHPAYSAVVKRLDGRTLMLSGGQRGEWDPTSGTGTAPLAAVGANLANLARVLPGLRDVSVRLTDASRPEAMTYDSIPIVDRLPASPRTIVATGFSGHGFMIAPAVADDVVTWLVEGDRPTDLAAFGLDRFRSMRR